MYGKTLEILKDQYDGEYPYDLHLMCYIMTGIPPDFTVMKELEESILLYYMVALVSDDSNTMKAVEDTISRITSPDRCKRALERIPQLSNNIIHLLNRRLTLLRSMNVRLNLSNPEVLIGSVINFIEVILDSFEPRPEPKPSLFSRISLMIGGLAFVSLVYLILGIAYNFSKDLY